MYIYIYIVNCIVIYVCTYMCMHLYVYVYHVYTHGTYTRCVRALDGSLWNLNRKVAHPVVLDFRDCPM